MTVLRTERLTLRPISLTDHAVVLAHWTAPRVCRFLFDGKAPTPARVSEFITASERDFATAGYGLWAMRLAGNELIGTAGLRPLDEGDGGERGETEIIYSLEPAYWGRGFAAEAVRAVLAHAFEVVALDRVIAEIDEGNNASTALARRLGMRLVGETPGELGRLFQYAITRAEWLGSRREAVD
jgi:RimJ/RimL family protein N-acetyltransferase